MLPPLGPAAAAAEAGGGGCVSTHTQVVPRASATRCSRLVASTWTTSLGAEASVATQRQALRGRQNGAPLVLLRHVANDMAHVFLSMVSHAQATPRYGTMDARPTFQLSTSGCHLTKTLHCAHASHAAAVRCCTASGKCFSVCRPAQGRSRGTAPRLCASGFASNWSEASAECAAHGAALCTHLELAACCKTGCAMDTMLTWTRSRCGSEPNAVPSSEQVTLPRIDSRSSRQNRAACSTHGITNQTALRAPISGCGLVPALTAQVEPGRQQVASAGAARAHAGHLAAARQ